MRNNLVENPRTIIFYSSAVLILMTSLITACAKGELWAANYMVEYNRRTDSLNVKPGSEGAEKHLDKVFAVINGNGEERAVPVNMLPIVLAEGEEFSTLVTGNPYKGETTHCGVFEIIVVPDPDLQLTNNHCTEHVK